ncbi:MAG TPA: YXWGXW repeat-containing protein [Polyangiaceae bacterium]|nr:YXWGXW repeat-containing protein [Polyangiaceae bacterium]
MGYCLKIVAMWTRAQHRIAAWQLGLTLALSTSGCVLGLETPAAGPKHERPEARLETPPPKPKDCESDCRWSPGYWHWDGGGYVWVDGHWEQGGPAAAAITE